MPPKKPTPVKAPVRAAAAKAPTKAAAPARKTGPAATGPKKGAAPAGGNKGKATEPQKQQKPKERVWTEKDDAARKIQTKYRQFRAKKLLEKKKKEKEEYEELMDKLEKEAFAKLVKMEQEQAEKERKKEEEERRRRQEEAKRRKRVLEASFDGDIDEIETVLSEVIKLDDEKGVSKDVIGTAIRNKHIMAVIECEDANGNTPLSEAANGGHADTVKFLLQKGSDPNTKGQFQRTPLYRAAFAGHLEVVQILLQSGADPRLYASDGQTPEQISSIGAVTEVLGEWDISQTEILLQKLEAEKEVRREEERKRREAEQSKLEGQKDTAQQEYDMLQRQLNCAYEELNKRINEHDVAIASGFDRPEILVQAIHDQEDEVEILKMNTEKAREKLANAKLRLREQEKEGTVEGQDLPGVQVMIRDLEDVLLRDVGNKIKDSGKWPLLIDTSSQAVTFLRYRDTNYLNALSPKAMEPDKIRIGILGAIRFGKPLVLDMMDVDMFETVSDRFDEVLNGLMNMIMDHSIKQEENYLKLVKPTDGPDYEKNKFNDYRTNNFKFYIVTKNPYPPESLMEKTYPIRIYVPIV